MSRREGQTFSLQRGWVRSSQTIEIRTKGGLITARPVRWCSASGIWKTGEAYFSFREVNLVRASRYLSRVFSTTSFGSRGGGGVFGQSSVLK